MISPYIKFIWDIVTLIVDILNQAYGMEGGRNLVMLPLPMLCVLCDVYFPKSYNSTVNPYRLLVLIQFTKLWDYRPHIVRTITHTQLFRIHCSETKVREFDTSATGNFNLFITSILKMLIFYFIGP